MNASNQSNNEPAAGGTRRELLERLGKGAAYVAPATLLLLSKKANASP
jgi:hypothetical protein